MDMIVCGAGTGGTVAGIGRKIKEELPSCKVEGGRERKREGQRESIRLSCQVTNGHLPCSCACICI